MNIVDQLTEQMQQLHAFAACYPALMEHVSNISMQTAGENTHIIVVPDNTIEIRELRDICAAMPEAQWHRKSGYRGKLDWEGKIGAITISLVEMEDQTKSTLVFPETTEAA